ncbi:hypothetical protein EDEG_00583 [Edhazardia aedis USNM 41457]|uniref:Uncharacterized protein n=1 Tax=Edhazardia aedis (strain USNM 41457) TaxID=1003232 RepID=J9DVP4_EDHAE|nr:hypothetical protein EDEG_00583 [Edhazardia aedis USNM 41457]|eukprot:EJW05357.1 hypothetical protein EDEG_00583 [Edhazardia aedis USNM 41457]
MSDEMKDQKKDDNDGLARTTAMARFAFFYMLYFSLMMVLSFSSSFPDGYKMLMEGPVISFFISTVAFIIEFTSDKSAGLIKNIFRMLCVIVCGYLTWDKIVYSINKFRTEKF